MAERTGPNTHKAIARGHAPKAGIIEPGEFVPEGLPIGSWMAPVDSEGNPGEPTPREDKTTDGLQGMTRRALIDMAKASGIPVETDANKTALIKSLREARELS